MEQRKNYILLYGKINEFYIMENATAEEVKAECNKKESYGNYGREGVTAYPLPEPIYKLDEEGKILIDKISTQTQLPSQTPEHINTKISFYIKSTKANKKGLKPLIAQIAYNNKRTRKTLFLINPEHWDSVKQRIIINSTESINSPIYLLYNKTLDILSYKTDSLFNKYLLKKRKIPERELLRIFYTDKEISTLPRKSKESH